MEGILKYVWWVIPAVLHCILYCWLVVKNSENKFWHGSTLAMFLWGAVALWLFISKFVPKEKLVSIGIFYDLIMISTTIIATAIFTGQVASFSTLQWVGIVVCFLGFVLLETG